MNEKKLTHDLLEQHRIAAIELKWAKENELELRNQITDVLLEGKSVGTHNFSMHGFKIKSVKGVKHSFDTELLEEMIENKELSDEELELLRVKYDLKLSEYKEATFDTSVLDDAIIVRPSLPTLAISIGE